MPPTVLRRCRDNAWDKIASRQHVILKVYSSQPDTSEDLLLLGYNTMQLRNGKTVVLDFVARIVLEEPSSGEIRIKSCESWAVSTDSTSPTKGDLFAD